MTIEVRRRPSAPYGSGGAPRLLTDYRLQYLNAAVNM